MLGDWKVRVTEVDELRLNCLSDTDVARLQIAVRKMDVLGEQQSHGRLYQYAELGTDRNGLDVSHDEMVCALVSVVVHDDTFVVGKSTLLSKVDIEVGAQCVEPPEVIAFAGAHCLDYLILALNCVIASSSLHTLSNDDRVL